jgi:hypothetical protein
MAKPGEYDFVPMMPRGWIGDMLTNTLSVGIFQWIYKADGHGLKKSKVVYRIKGPSDMWHRINSRARVLCDFLNKYDPKMETLGGKKSETI